MGFIKRIGFFLVLNFLIVITISIVLSLLGVQPYLQRAGLNYRSLAVFCFLWGMLGAGISLALSKKMALWMMKIRLIQRGSSHEFLLHTVERLAKKAHIPMPDVGIYPGKEVNAFATGPTKRHSLIAVSEGLLHKMDPDEIEGVLAHELAHIENGDMVTMTLLQGVVNAFVMFFARALAYAVSGLGRGDRRSSYMTYIFCVYAFEICFMILGSLLVSGFSRFREYRADRGGARLAGTNKMIRALETLLAQNSSAPADIPQEQAAFNSLKISSNRKSNWLRLFASHPPLEERIARLRSS
ncbi:MAG: protease HtpX [Chlamydiota bacterium]